MGFAWFNRRMLHGAVALLALATASCADGLAQDFGNPALRAQYQPDGYGPRGNPYPPGPQYDQGPYGRDPRYGYDRGNDRGYDRGPDRGYDRRYEQDDRRERRQSFGGGGPAGSYQQSCGDIRQSGSTLTAVCANGRGRQTQTSIDVNRCGRSDIGNNRGVLQCGGVRGSGG